MLACKTERDCPPTEMPWVLEGCSTETNECSYSMRHTAEAQQAEVEENERANESSACEGMTTLSPAIWAKTRS